MTLGHESPLDQLTAHPVFGYRISCRRAIRRGLVDLRAKLGEVIRKDEDQVVSVHVGRVEGRGSTSITSLGPPYLYPERHAVVV